MNSTGSACVQRLSLFEKGTQPDVLVMTATPIPRTLALTLYGDLDVSTIDELPPGRQPIVTKHVPRIGGRRGLSASWRSRSRRDVRLMLSIRWWRRSETAAVKAAEQMFPTSVARASFPELRSGCCMARCRPIDKEAAMRASSGARRKFWFATTVIEVGVDVPNASVMVIEQAERFGLAQIHQLRGRVGRGPHQSYCILVTGKMNDVARERIRTLVESNDGFYIAEMDMRLRGPGEFFGTKQSGIPGLRLADLIRDAEVLETARKEALRIVERNRILMNCGLWCATSRNIGSAATDWCRWAEPGEKPCG